ncbi:MAG: serine hydrolase domain-containing protein [Saprospiraceae bacterium]|nr:serine hydrolase domain-containing protein [Saprospiraceae bacterium]
MKQIFFIWLLGLSATGLFSCKKDIGHTTDCMPTPATAHPKAALYQSVLDLHIAKGLPGLSALIRDKDGVWVGAAGMADISKGIEMKPCMVSKAASITKTFIGALTLKLVEEGAFGLDDPLSKWIPGDILDQVKNSRESTVRMCLNHTTGIADVIEDDGFYLTVLNDPARKWEPEALLRYVYGDEPEYPAGTDASYSNTNFVFLAMVMEAATGKDHAALLREKIIAPLGFEHTFYYWHDPLPAETAQGYFDLYNNQTLLNVTNYNTGSGNGYGGLYSNVYDLQRFIELLVREKTMLQAASLDAMLTFTDPVEGVNRANGLGIFRDFLERAPNQYAYGHRGRDLGYTADMYWFPEQDVTMVYFLNYGTDAESSLKPYFREFRSALVDAIMQ